MKADGQCLCIMEWGISYGPQMSAFRMGVVYDYVDLTPPSEPNNVAILIWGPGRDRETEEPKTAFAYLPKRSVFDQMFLKFTFSEEV